jgi:hypothetical protein
VLFSVSLLNEGFKKSEAFNIITKPVQATINLVTLIALLKLFDYQGYKKRRLQEASTLPSSLFKTKSEASKKDRQASSSLLYRDVKQSTQIVSSVGRETVTRFQKFIEGTVTNTEGSAPNHDNN